VSLRENCVLLHTGTGSFSDKCCLIPTATAGVLYTVTKIVNSSPAVCSDVIIRSGAGRGVVATADGVGTK